MKKNDLKRYKYMLLAVLCSTSLGIGASKPPVQEKTVNTSVSEETNTNINIDFSNIISNNHISIIASRLIDIYKNYTNPGNIDFSDFPYRDGSIESMINIARYIREKVKFIPNPAKYKYILEHHKMSKQDFLDFYAVFKLEGKAGKNCYEETFGAITSICNRAISKTKNGYIRKWCNIEGSVSIYDHLVAPSQYSPYIDGSYLDELGVIEKESFQACLDSLFVMDVMPERMHDWMDFVAPGLQHKRPNPVQLFRGGNWYSNPLTENDIIPVEERYYFSIEEENVLKLK